MIFSRHYSQYLEKNINKITNSQIFITHELENRYFFPINDKKIVVAKIGKDFSWFSFVTLFITFYGLILYIFGMINIYNVFDDTITFYGILILTVVTFAIGYWWFVNNTGEKRLKEYMTTDFMNFNGDSLDNYLGHEMIEINDCLLYTSPSPRDRFLSRMPSSA